MRFDDVTFSYPDAETPATRDVSFEVETGETVAAGATVPRGKEDEFVAEADKHVGEQLSN